MSNVFVNGINLAYEVAGTGPNLLLIHGLGWSRRQWVLQMPVFAQHYRTFAIDYRGHGDSDRSAVPHTLQDICDDLYAFMQVLELEQTHLLGFSQGGMIAQLFTLDHPEKVCGLILSDAPIRSDPGFVDHYVQVIQELEPNARAARLAQANIEAEIPNNVREIIEEDFQQFSKETLVRNYEAERGFDVEPRLHEIRQPTLIIVGEKDRLVGDAQQEHRLIAGSQLVMIKGSGHSPCIENPEVFNRAPDSPSCA